MSSPDAISMTQRFSVEDGWEETYHSLRPSDSCREVPINMLSGAVSKLPYAPATTMNVSRVVVTAFTTLSNLVTAKLHFAANQVPAKTTFECKAFSLAISMVKGVQGEDKHEDRRPRTLSEAQPSLFGLECQEARPYSVYQVYRDTEERRSG